MDAILFALWFFLPADFATMAPVFAKKIKFLDPLNTPMDFGKTFRGKRVFGENKTFRGLLSGFVAALIFLILQVWLFDHVSFVREYSLFDYSSMNVLLFSAMFTLGAIGGDAIESFFKRQMNMKPGKSWVPFDQIDWILGAVVLSLPLTNFDWSIYVYAIIWALVLHPVSTTIGWALKLKDKPI